MRLSLKPFCLFALSVLCFFCLCGCALSATSPPTATVVSEFGTEIAVTSPPDMPETEPMTSVATPVPSSVQPTNSPKSVAPAKIALLDDLQSSEGQERLNWARMAVEDFTSETGWPVELEEVDVGSDAMTIMDAMNPVINDQTVYTVIGPPYFNQINAAVLMSQMIGLPHLIFNGTPELTQPGVYRLVPTDDLQGAAGANFLVNTLGAKKIFVIVASGQGAPGTYGYDLYQTFEQALNEAGGVVVKRVPVIADETNFDPLVADLQASGAEAVFVADTSAEQAVQLNQALQNAGVSIPILAHDGWAEAQVAANAEGVYVLSPTPALADDNLAQRYITQYGVYGVYGPLTYTASMIALQAMQRANETGQLNRSTVQKEIAEGSATILGYPFAFNSDGTLQGAHFYVLKVENGVFKTVEP